MSIPNTTDSTGYDDADEVDGDVITTQTGPAAWVPAWILPGDLCPFSADDRLTPGEVVIYVAMRSFADRQRTERARAETVAERAGCGVKSVYNAYAKFRRLRIMVSERRLRRDGSIAGLNILLRDTPPSSTPPSSTAPELPHTVKTRENTPREHLTPLRGVPPRPTPAPSRRRSPGYRRRR